MKLFDRKPRAMRLEPGARAIGPPAQTTAAASPIPASGPWTVPAKG